MIAIAVFVFFGALSLGLIGGVIFGVIRAITLATMRSRRRKQEAAWASHQAHNPPWVQEQPWLPPQQPYYGPDQHRP